jgi:hypothetical protein
MALDKRQLESVDQLWSTVNELAAAKAISRLVNVFKYERVAEEAAKNGRLREMFKMIGAGIDLKKIDLSGSRKARPFVSPMAWALFSAYEAIALHAVAKVHLLQSGIADKDLLDKDVLPKLIKAALPHRAQYVDEFGDRGYHFLLDEIEEALLVEMRGMLAGAEADKASVERAAVISRLAAEAKPREETTLPSNDDMVASPAPPPERV